MSSQATNRLTKRAITWIVSTFAAVLTTTGFFEVAHSQLMSPPPDLNVVQSIHSAGLTDNAQPCQKDHPLVSNFGNSAVRLSGQNRDGVWLPSAGLLLNCSTLVTVGHTIYDKDEKTPLKNLRYMRLSAQGSITALPHDAKIQEGPWKTTGRFSDELTIIRIPTRTNQCTEIPILEHFDASKAYKMATSKIKFFLLKLDRASYEVCAQECKVEDAIGESPQSTAFNSVVHDCQTQPGNSGSPVFAQAPNSGAFYLVGLHVAAHPLRSGVNLFTPIEGSDPRINR